VRKMYNAFGVNAAWHNYFVSCIISLYLYGKKCRSSKSNPAVQRVEVRSVSSVVVVEHGAKTHDGQHQGQEHHGGMQQLPGELIVTPG